MYDASSITRMNQVQRLIPLVLFGIISTLFAIHIGNRGACRNPEKGCQQDNTHCRNENKHGHLKAGHQNVPFQFLEILTDDVVTHETQHLVDVNFLNDVPESFDNILDTFLANALQPFEREIM